MYGDRRMSPASGNPVTDNITPPKKYVKYFCFTPNGVNEMKCKSCKNEIPNGSIFCMFCGEKQIREKKKKDEIKVPKPIQLPSGAWRIQLRAEGQSVTEATPELCITKAKAIRAGFVEQKANQPRITLDDSIKEYIDSNSAVLSPSTLHSYEIIRKYRFSEYSSCDISSIDWQRAINEEAALCAPKTLKNAWGLIARVMRCNGLQVPDVHLPQVTRKDAPWLNYEQIQTFLNAIQNHPCEIAALLALHSLRRSELLAITPSKIDSYGIHVSGAIVPNREGKFIEKDTNKNNASARVVPIMIPRLQDLIDSSNVKQNEPYVTLHPNDIYNAVNRICKNAKLPEVGVHGLRRSFASLAYHAGWPERVTMQIGGWSDWQTMHKIYIKLDESDVKSATEKMKCIYQEMLNC